MSSWSAGKLGGAERPIPQGRDFTSCFGGSLAGQAARRGLHTPDDVPVFHCNEGLSITENLGLMGVPMPGFLKNMLEAMRDKSDIGRANKD